MCIKKFNKSTKDDVMLNLACTYAFLQDVSAYDHGQSVFVRGIMDAVFGPIGVKNENGRYSYNEVRKNGVRRVKVFIKDDARLSGKDLYKMYALLNIVFKEQKLSVRAVFKSYKPSIQNSYISVRFYPKGK